MDQLRDQQLVKLARSLERLQARARREAKVLQGTQDAIRTTRKLIRELTTAEAFYSPGPPLPGEVQEG